MQYDRTQLLKGLLEGMILLILRRAPLYGYAIREELEKNGLKDAKEGAVYPVLLRLERKGLARGTFRASPNGPSRKYYEVTQAGRDYLTEFESAWREVGETVAHLMEWKEETP